MLRGEAGGNSLFPLPLSLYCQQARCSGSKFLPRLYHRPQLPSPTLRRGWSLEGNFYCSLPLTLLLPYLNAAYQSAASSIPTDFHSWLLVFTAARRRFMLARDMREEGNYSGGVRFIAIVAKAAAVWMAYLGAGSLNRQC